MFICSNKLSLKLYTSGAFKGKGAYLNAKFDSLSSSELLSVRVLPRSTKQYRDIFCPFRCYKLA